MADFDNKSVLEALSVPVGDLIASVGRGIAQAQSAMDAASIAALRDVYEANEGLFHELQRIGYRPTWYHIPEAEGELQVALTVAGSKTEQPPGQGNPSKASAIKLYAAPVDAGYSSRFNFTLQATSRIKFRIVSVPPSTAAEAMQVVPALVGLSIADARSRLTLLRIEGEFPEDAPDEALVTTQTPEAGTLLGSGALVTVGIE